MKQAGWICMLLLVFLAGCSAGDTEYTRLDDRVFTATETPSPSAKEENAIIAEQEAENVQTNLILAVNDTKIPVIWEDNPSVAELSKQASSEPIHIVMSMYGGWEQVGSLGHSISRNDVPQTAANGDIMLYSGNQIVLFYGKNTWSYTKLGHIDLPDEEVTSLLSSGAVSITITVS